MDRVTRHMVFQFPHTYDHNDSGKDVWNPSPDRESQLEVVRSGSLYDLRAYRGERKPSKLYEDDEPDPYRLQPPNISPEKAKELEDKRREVIRGQVVRKSSTMAENQGVPGAFAVCFDKPSPGRAVTPVDPESIDREQINFSAARQQFLMLEKSSPGALFSPGYSPRPEVTVRTSRQDAGYSSNGSNVPNGLGEAKDGGGSAGGSGETPIEREIRRALEREESLWKERGMQRLTSSSELVEIQTKPLLSLHTAPAQGRKGKDKGRASFNVQREIEKETKREEDLRRQGRLPGLYDRGTPQELGELRRVFEQEEQQPSSSRRVAERPRSPADGLDDGTRTGRAPSSPAVTPSHQRGRDELRPYESASAGTRAREDAAGGKLPGPTPSPVLRREHFAISFWQPRISVSDGMGTRSAALRERSPDGEHGRDEQYTLRTWRPQRSALIEEEIRSDLQREEELQEQRRRRLMDGGDGTSRESSRSRHSSGKGRADPAPRVRRCPPGDRSAPCRVPQRQGGTSGCGAAGSEPSAVGTGRDNAELRTQRLFPSLCPQPPRVPAAVTRCPARRSRPRSSRAFWAWSHPSPRCG
uniref:A-kinase anchor protein 2 C-terminal domain-containing protein n=1 Tax=Pavo cristatus TaxID=9049 RepID=A0A8C9FAU2_PAVCR